MQNAAKTIILVADVRGWAFDSIAQYVSNIIDDVYDCHVIYTSDYKNYEDFFESLGNYPRIDFMHFFYRGYLAELIEYIATRKSHQDLDLPLMKFLNAATTTNIPDHLFIDTNQAILNKAHLFSFVDNYYPVSQKLHDIYSSIKLYKKPWKVIYDNIEVPKMTPSLTSAANKLVVTWIGNSAWGEWYFGSGYDSKGFKTTIIPTLELASQKIKGLEYHVADAVTSPRSKEEIHELLRKTDILLIGAKTEGTPLPVIEAMASGCVIISTNVGIVPEILPDIQKEFILSKTLTAFVGAIQKLNNNRALLHKLKKQNFDAYQNLFNDSGYFKNLWLSFIEDSIYVLKTESRKTTKQSILDNLRNDEKQMSNFSARKIAKNILSNQHLKKAARVMFKYPALNWLLRSTYFILEHLAIGNTYNNFKKQLDVSIESAASQSEQVDAKIYAIYPDRFPGVANSTRKLFHNTLSIASSGITEFRGLRQSIVDKIAALLIEKKISPIVMSGGSIAQLQLTKKLHELNPEIKIYYLWHGSPAQWCDQHHHKSFAKWMTLYREGKIQAIVTLKKDLEKLLADNNVKTALLQNFIPIIQHKLHRYDSEGSLNIGIWSAYNTWIKNLYPQFMAISMAQNVKCYTNFHFKKDDEWITEGVELHNLPQILPHKELLELMSQTDLTLYITNSECSPMVVIESISMGIPCIVGPTSGFYDCDEFLKEMLTVNRVDCPVAIHAAIERVRNNLEDIKARIPEFITRYNKVAHDLKKEFYTLY